MRALVKQRPLNHNLWLSISGLGSDPVSSVQDLIKYESATAHGKASQLQNPSDKLPVQEESRLGRGAVQQAGLGISGGYFQIV